jgi:hypothetical protein
MRILGFNSQAANSTLESQRDGDHLIGADVGVAGHPVLSDPAFQAEQDRLAAARRVKARAEAGRVNAALA